MGDSNRTVHIRAQPLRFVFLSRLISGGQTGVDRAALDAALEAASTADSGVDSPPGVDPGADPYAGVAPTSGANPTSGADAAGPAVTVGGWCPRGRRAEDGLIAERYPLRETPSADYAQRTEWNVREADGTLVFTRGPASGGTRLTIDLARRYGRPYLVVDCAEDVSLIRRVDRIVAWIEEHGIETLNVAGPRESGAPGIYEEVRPIVASVLRRASGGEIRREN